MSGLYESFCYTANHTIEFQPAEPERVSSLLSSDYTGTLDPCGFHAVPPDFTDSPPISFLSSSPYQPYGNSLHTSSSGFCGRTYSWSSRTSARTTTNSSGYCSVNNSCPSSANSHRSTSPTPDFSNIKLLSANLEKCSLDEEGILEESDISSSGTDGDFLCTWPPFAGVSIREDCAGEAGDGNARVFTGKLRKLVDSTPLFIRTSNFRLRLGVLKYFEDVSLKCSQNVLVLGVHLLSSFRTDLPEA